jgi:hypothetical protein
MSGVRRDSPSMRDSRLELIPITSASSRTFTRAATRSSFMSRPEGRASVVMCERWHVRYVLSTPERQDDAANVPKRANVRAVKTAAERGQIGAWAYEARAEADLSVPEVIRQLKARGQAVTEPTLRGIEGGSKKPGRRLLRELASIYGRPCRASRCRTSPTPWPPQSTVRRPCSSRCLRGWATCSRRLDDRVQRSGRRSSMQWPTFEQTCPLKVSKPEASPVVER